MKNLPVIRTRNCIKFINEKYSNRITHQVSFTPLKRPWSFSGQIEFRDEVVTFESVDCDLYDLFDFPDCWKSVPRHLGYFLQIKTVRFWVEWGQKEGSDPKWTVWSPTELSSTPKWMFRNDKSVWSSLLKFKIWTKVDGHGSKWTILMRLVPENERIHIFLQRSESD